MKGFDITSWQGYLGPAGMPKEIVTKLNAEIRKVVETPGDQGPARRARHGGRSRARRKQFDTFLKEQLVLWEKLITDSGDREAVTELVLTPPRRVGKAAATLRIWRGAPSAAFVFVDFYETEWLPPSSALSASWLRSPKVTAAAAGCVDGVLQQTLETVLIFAFADTTFGTSSPHSIPLPLRNALRAIIRARRKAAVGENTEPCGPSLDTHAGWSIGAPANSRRCLVKISVRFKPATQG